jgi:2-polyprenyl-3-methyl-5-hydroxy-6-metoxy-1,4-benzoquinol methylase
MSCHICRTEVLGKKYRVREMMYGLRDEFDYVQCESCRCLQVVSIPDLKKYYPENYYSFNFKIPKPNPLRGWLKRQMVAYKVYGQRDPLGRLLALCYRQSEAFYPWLARTKAPLTAKILDVGCGIGLLLCSLQESGYSDLTGVDPFITETIRYPNGVVVYKKQLQEMDGAFDFILLNHSLEHMPDQWFVMSHLSRLLSPGGHLVLRIPVLGYAWEKYGVHWVQLDAPRHLYLHSVASMKLLAEKTGFAVNEIVFDSNEFQFWGSEQYLRGIPLRDPRSHDEGSSLFTDAEMTEFRKQAEDLNARGEGDTATFYLSKP